MTTRARVAAGLAVLVAGGVAMLAVLRLGAVHVPVSPMFQGVELVHELGDAGAEVIVTCDSLLPLLDSVRPQTGVREVLVTSLDEMSGTAAPGGRVLADGVAAHPWARAVAHDPVEGPPADLDAPAALNYTGGTTGLPKGCVHTQRHMLYTAATSAAATRQAADSGYVALCYIPIFWIAVLLKEFGAIRFNEFLSNPVITIQAILLTGLIAGLIFMAIIGGSWKRRLITFASAFVAAGGMLALLGATNWFAAPSIGIVGVIITGIGAVYSQRPATSENAPRRIL